MVMLEADTAMPPGRMLKVRPPPSSTAWAQPEVGRAARERARRPPTPLFETPPVEGVPCVSLLTVPDAHAASTLPHVLVAPGLSIACCGRRARKAA